MTGVNEWDQAWLPRDEYGERLRLVRSLMGQNNWSGVVIHGDCNRCPIVTYLTNHHPFARWDLCLVGPEGDPLLLMAGGTRDLPAAADQTYLREVLSYGNADKILPEWISGLKASGKPRLGAYGFGAMRPPVHQTIAGILEPLADIDHADDRIDAALLGQKRPREIGMMQQACAIVERSLDAAQEAYRAGGTATEAAMAAERTARLAAVHDVRLMVSLDDGRTLQPFIHMRAERPAALVLYLAVRYTGYWAEGMLTLSDRPHAAKDAANAALDAMIAGLRPGMSGRDVAALAEPHRGKMQWHPVLGDRVGYGVGLALEESPLRRDGVDAAVADGTVFSLHAGFCDDSGAALASAILRMKDSRAEVLYRPRGEH
jgi:Xaa-Pro aminopeptidase